MLIFADAQYAKLLFIFDLLQVFALAATGLFLGGFCKSGQIRVLRGAHVGARGQDVGELNAQLQSRCLLFARADHIAFARRTVNGHFGRLGVRFIFYWQSAPR